MKTFAATILLAAFLLSPAFGQGVIARHHSLSLEAQSVSNGGSTTIKGDGKAKIEGVNTIGGGPAIQTEVAHLHEKRDTSSRTNVQVDIRNLGQTADNVRLEWYFVAIPFGGKAGSEREFIFDHGTQDVSLGANGTDSRVVTSKEARSAVERSATVLGGADGSGVSYVGGGNSRGSTKRSGILIRGWFVRLMDNDQIVATRGSSETYEELAKDDPKLKMFLAQSGGASKR